MTRSTCLLLSIASIAVACWTPTSEAFVAPAISTKNKDPLAWPGFHNTFVNLSSPSTATQHSTKVRSTSSTQLSLANNPIAKAVVVGLRAGAPAAVEVSDVISSCYDWCVNLGNPAALVAGAVVATLYENMSSGALDVDSRRDVSWKIRLGKRLTRVLLLSAFAFETISIFTTTVMGTMLLSRTLDEMDAVVELAKDATPLSFLQQNFEFEFLTARIMFLQGLIHWILAIATGHLVDSSANKSRDRKNMNLFIGGSLVTSIVVMMSFYNKHMSEFPSRKRMSRFC